MAARNYAVSFALLILIIAAVEGSKACYLICFDAAYMTCPSTGLQKLAPACNCCLAGSGCKIYAADGSLICSKP
ncbi:hypothetical protein M569_12608 [Genlisea aurea]|uniref:Uncharacterized protein n=1 Tax=Genlisea aurea TaxID=192259 RepID=S8C608_9LAMI|nr:hypothetical protein M569_12608 [Genlisea aurea]